ncbi:hypothetical protein [Stakelama pacifica]|uniref:Parallel beta helix pectate lyase-like protein n=1 Tax=Stakelama pacifica TaxID=517720 RepID=A0A4R6FPE9_9SPHN|nr:hypothetical protein [Stakelama pacifica]TDN82960.1 hypothetical protein EV664_105158 [Stakelama pacifica]GGO95078.1 hypothetical protein GCM10011329_18410 [Stakelama pacifica]
MDVYGLFGARGLLPGVSERAIAALGLTEMEALEAIAEATTVESGLRAIGILPGTGGAPYRNRLMYRPPALSAPITTILPAGYQGDPAGASTATDLLFLAPAIPRVSGFNLTKGRNVRLIGGRIDYNPGTGSRAIQWAGISESIFIEGVAVNLIRRPSDAFSAGGGAGLYPDVYLQNCWCNGLRGENATLHPDFFQLSYPIRNFYSHKTTFTTNYQGFFLAAQSAITGNLVIDESNAYCLDNTAADSGYASAYWFSDSVDQWNNTSHKIVCRKIYVAPGTDRTVRDRVTIYAPGYPDGRGVLSSDEQGQFVWYPDLYPRLSDGRGNPAKFREGTPPGGDYCRENDVGSGYGSPGYR